MKRARVIPILLLRNRGMHKSVSFGPGKYLGDPINAVRIFNDKQCDELVVLDTDVSKTGGSIDVKNLAELATECFMPLTYGGGVRNLKDIERLLKLGFEKVSLNSALRNDTSIVAEAVREFGSSTIVGSIDVKRNWLGQYRLFDHIRSQTLSVSLDAFLDTLNELGLGEVLVNSVDLDGTMKGFDLELAQRVSNRLLMPVVFAGGCRDFEDIRRLLNTTAVSAAGVGSHFVFHGPHRALLISYPEPSEISGLYLSAQSA